ncbi:type I secretion system permease/ATPase [Falsihalocynthiibacter sp. SS001]|uniref:type I secretion system permease/ATPase n=1 Tax=Falsihalocynthiibacter sp. SS001 TaxID=3349698 RepID=UPI0036D38230
MTKAITCAGKHELSAALRANRPVMWAVAVFSFFVNLLMLTGPIFMLQVYDRVLTSQSQETLVALSLIATFLFVCMGLLDYARGRIMAWAGANFQKTMSKRVFSSALKPPKSSVQNQKAETAIDDLDAVQSFLSSNTVTALFDIPWTPFFLLLVFAFHPLLGGMALVGASILILLALVNQSGTKSIATSASSEAQKAAQQFADWRNEGREGQQLHHQVAERWMAQRDLAQDQLEVLQKRTGSIAVSARTFRQFLQSAMLALGALLVISNQLSAGAMIASSILLGRALHPLEQVIGGWPQAQRARAGWRSLAELLAACPPQQVLTELPAPIAHLGVDNLAVSPPGHHQPTLRNISFSIKSGQAMGIIGPSGAGKSTLAKAIIGTWKPLHGQIRLAGAALEQYGDIEKHIGYLPQKARLFSGTIAENIARMAPEYKDEDIIQAAQAAGAHALILSLPEGYNTQVGTGNLSGGEVQRVALARAFYQRPPILVLDEPNANLDHDGTVALNSAIRRAKHLGAAVIVIAHRPAALSECDTLLALDQGRMTALGPKDEVLHNLISQIRKDAA